MHVLTKEVESIITKLLPDKFALIFDGWKSGDTHFVGIFASFISWERRNVNCAFMRSDKTGRFSFCI